MLKQKKVELVPRTLILINKNPNPAYPCEQRISDEGLQRLQKQLQSGVRISDRVLQQWKSTEMRAALLININPAAAIDISSRCQ